jgi:hypothetical protein
MTGHAFRPVLVCVAAGALLGAWAAYLGGTTDRVFIWALLGPWYLTDVIGGGTQGWSLYLFAVAYYGALGGAICLLVTRRPSKVRLAVALLLLLTGHAAMWTAGAQRFSRALASMGPLPVEAIPDSLFKASPTPGHQ